MSRAFGSYTQKVVDGLENDGGMGHAYVVGVVDRGAMGAPPKGIDLLVDPVNLVEDGSLERIVDGYELGYTVTA